MQHSSTKPPWNVKVDSLKAIRLWVFISMCPLMTCSPASSFEKSPAALCPDDLPAFCPEQVPSYQTNISPLLQQFCLECHSSNGEAANHDLSTYQAVFADRRNVLAQVYSCRMPPVQVPQLSTQQRKDLLTWFVCQAPDN
jgi:hypothetical protein